MAKFDLAKTGIVMRLFQTALDARDDAWRREFFEAIVDASLASSPSQVVTGPDGFPYFTLQSPPARQAFTPFCLSHIASHCTDNGLGIVVNPTAKGVDWVFSYGDLFSFRAYQTLEGDPLDNQNAGAAEEHVMPANQQFLIAAPSEQLLPGWSRTVISSFLKRAAHIVDPRVLLLIDSSRPHVRNLVFNIHPEDFASHDDFKKILDRLGWFLPRGRSVVTIPRASSLTSSFMPL